MEGISKANLTVLIFGMAFLYIPIFFLIFFSFSESPIVGLWTKFSMKWFKAVFEDLSLLKAALTSIKVAAISATAATLLGLMTAITTTKGEDFIGRKFLNRAITMPVVMPEIIIGFSLLMLFITIEKTTGFSIKDGITTIAIGHIMASMTYVHVTIRARLTDFDRRIEESALNLGANLFKVLIYVTIPLISKSIFAGWLLAFTLSLDDLVIASFLSGPGATTLPILIFSNIRVGLTPAINAFSTIFIAVTVLLILVIHFASRDKRR
ncbi:MAG: ABC transporter permease subunit [Holosporales bacterium]|jgi:putrescine transport system permease protein|nr:ABC transporter permease subunit [Holosporales bacterium]